MTAYFGMEIRESGQSGSEAEQVLPEPDDWDEWSLNIDPPHEEWELRLPHQCDHWVIGHGTQADCLAAAKALRVELDAAIAKLEMEAS